jgi:hypothetical protein
MGTPTAALRDELAGIDEVLDGRACQEVMPVQGYCCSFHEIYFNARQCCFQVGEKRMNTSL